MLIPRGLPGGRAQSSGPPPDIMPLCPLPTSATGHAHSPRPLCRDMLNPGGDRTGTCSFFAATTGHDATVPRHPGISSTCLRVSSAGASDVASGPVFVCADSGEHRRSFNNPCLEPAVLPPVRCPVTRDPRCRGTKPLDCCGSQHQSGPGNAQVQGPSESDRTGGMGAKTALGDELKRHLDRSNGREYCRP